jgi:hypothetical protein
MIGALPPSKFVPKTGDFFQAIPKGPPRTPPHLEISRNSVVRSDARDQGAHRQAPLHLALRRRQPCPLPPLLRHLLPSASAARRSGRLQPRPERSALLLPHSPPSGFVDTETTLCVWRAGCGAESVVAFPCTVQQQVFAEGLPVRERRLPFWGVGLGWAL